MRALICLLLLSVQSQCIYALAAPRTVLVTGGAGYIGSHTCLELLKVPDNVYKVVVVDNLDNSSEESLERVKALAQCDSSRIEFRNCDIRCVSMPLVFPDTNLPSHTFKLSCLVTKTV